MAESTTSTMDSGARKEPSGFTELISRVLEQLAVSAWLPAAMLIGVGSLLVQLAINGNLNIPDAVADLANPQSWGIIIILLFGLILTTMVTQAFSFGIIRLLEGYWDSGLLVGWLVKARVERHVKRADRLRKRTIDLERALFKSAVGSLTGENPLHVQVWNEQLHLLKRDRKQTDAEVIRAANNIDWRKKGDPGIAALFYRAHDRQADYPNERTRTLPTRLGNVLRSSEERLGLKGQALERFIMENYNTIPRRLMTQHDQFRDRLDMYALLALVFATLAVGSIPLLWSIHGPLTWLPASALLFIILALLAWMSYCAAIASARGYGSALLAIGRAVKETRVTNATGAGSSASSLTHDLRRG